MSASSPMSTQVQRTDLCATCDHSIHYPCEISQWVDCPRCLDQIHVCKACAGIGHGRTKLRNGEYPKCGNCRGDGWLAYCPSCKGAGYFTVVGQHHEAIECEDCRGEGLRPCECNDKFRVLRFRGLCTGDYLDGVRRVHPKPPANPRSRVLKKHWGEVKLPYDPTSLSRQ